MIIKPNSSLLLKAILISAGVVCLMGPSRAALADNFCTHGTAIIDEDRGSSTYATRLITGDFDGDGKTDKLCKDVRKDDSNSNRLLEWLVLGNGKTVFSGQWNDWCTHRDSKVSVQKKDGKDILVCTDQQRNRWERELP